MFFYIIDNKKQNGCDNMRKKIIRDIAKLGKDFTCSIIFDNRHGALIPINYVIAGNDYNLKIRQAQYSGYFVNETTLEKALKYFDDLI